MSVPATARCTQSKSVRVVLDVIAAVAVAVVVACDRVSRCCRSKEKIRSGVSDDET